MKQREKVYRDHEQRLPLDRNAKARIVAYARAWTARNRQPGQHKGPLTRAFMEVLEALLWRFHNSRDGRCFPSYERIAEAAGCARSTVAEALKALEWAGVLTWQQRIVRVRERCEDLFGGAAWRWRVVRTSNAYAFKDPASKSENRTGTPIQDAVDKMGDPDSPLERALHRFAATIAAKNAQEIRTDERRSR